MELVFATHNKHKVSEIRHILPVTVSLVTLDDIGCMEDIPETGQTLEENALQKAIYVHQKYGCNCFADDTGLEVDALGGMPGVISARYAGEGKSAEDNVKKLLGEMEGLNDRKAVFKTVIAFIVNKEKYLFKGEVKGRISVKRVGENGFGYDPVFIPEGEMRSFAQMTLEEKNTLSHRARAVNKFVQFINTLR